jgi:hypothetical protein
MNEIKRFKIYFGFILVTTNMDLMEYYIYHNI